MTWTSLLKLPFAKFCWLSVITPLLMGLWTSIFSPQYDPLTSSLAHNFPRDYVFPFTLQSDYWCLDKKKRGIIASLSNRTTF